MRRLCLIAFSFLALALAAAQDCVIYCMGWPRSEASFALMAHSLKPQGYHVQNPEFSTRSKTIAELVCDTIPQAVQACGNQR